MNCHVCGERNPSSSKRCLHCNAEFEQDKEGIIDSLVESDGDGSKLFWVIGIVFVAIIGGAMLIGGFDTYESKCVGSKSAAATLEADPAWLRDESAERFKRSDEERRYRERGGIGTTRHDYLRCYKRKTGHVDGIRSK